MELNPQEVHALTERIGAAIMEHDSKNGDLIIAATINILRHIAIAHPKALDTIVLAFMAMVSVVQEENNPEALH